MASTEPGPGRLTATADVKSFDEAPLDRPVGGLGRADAGKGAVDRAGDRGDVCEARLDGHDDAGDGNFDAHLHGIVESPTTDRSLDSSREDGEGRVLVFARLRRRGDRLRWNRDRGATSATAGARSVAGELVVAAGRLRGRFFPSRVLRVESRR